MSSSLKKLTETPDAIEIICDTVASGGSLVEFAKVYDIRYYQLLKWIRSDDSRNAQYQQALTDREEWDRDLILREVKAIAVSDIRQLFREDGTMLPPGAWPEWAAKAVAGVDIREEYDQGKFVGFSKKVKLWDKMRALETLGKRLGIFVDGKQPVEVKLTLEQLVDGGPKKN